MQETLLDSDTFAVRFLSPSLTLDERKLILAATLLIDLQYFENNTQSLVPTFGDIGG